MGDTQHAVSRHSDGRLTAFDRVAATLVAGSVFEVLATLGEVFLNEYQQEPDSERPMCICADRDDAQDDADAMASIGMRRIGLWRVRLKERADV